jgi:hypothetical protein
MIKGVIIDRLLSPLRGNLRFAPCVPMGREIREINGPIMGSGRLNIYIINRLNKKTAPFSTLTLHFEASKQQLKL